MIYITSVFHVGLQILPGLGNSSKELLLQVKSYLLKNNLFKNLTKKMLDLSKR